MNLSASEIRKLPRNERHAILCESARDAIEDGLYADVTDTDELLGDRPGDLVAELRMLAGKLGPCWESNAMKRAATQIEQQLAAAPAWCDVPTHAGDWAGKNVENGLLIACHFSEEVLKDGSADWLILGKRWFPLPTDESFWPPTLQPSADDGAPVDPAENGA